MAKKPVKAKLTLTSVLNRALLALEMRRFKTGTISHLEYRDAFLFISNHLKADVAGSLDTVTKFAPRPVPVLTASKRAPQLKSDKAIRVTKKVDTKAIQKKWAEKKEGNPGQVLRFDTSKEYPDSPFADLFPVTAKEPLHATNASGFTCSYCNAPVEYARATIGKKTSIMIIPELHTDSDGNMTIEDRVSSRTQNIIACGDCSLKVKPKDVRWVNPEAI